MALASRLSNSSLPSFSRAVEKLPKLRFSTCNARLNCTHGNLQHFGDFFVGEIFEIVKHEGRPIILVNIVQAVEHRFDIHSADVTSVVGLLHCIIKRFLRKSLLASALLQKLTVQCGEEPAFGISRLPELMSFTRPDVKSLLGQISRIGFASSEAKAELVQIAVISIHQFFEVRLGGGHKPLTSSKRSHQRFCSREQQNSAEH